MMLLFLPIQRITNHPQVFATLICIFILFSLEGGEVKDTHSLNTSELSSYKVIIIQEVCYKASHKVF